MNGHEVIVELSTAIELATTHFSAMSTFVLLYIVGLYAFLRRAPLPVRIFAYVFFVSSFAIFVVLGVSVLEVFDLAQAIQDEGLAGGAFSETFTEVLSPRWYRPILELTPAVWYLVVTATVIALGWLTFFYHWGGVETD